MGISTFGSFTMARLGIYASQAGLSITGNNISNINTHGYTRQKLNQSSFYAGGSDRYYSSSSVAIGNGVLCTGTSQLRDSYLDLRYRNEMSSVGYNDAKLGGLEHIQRILDETGKGEEGFGILGAQISDFFKQLENLNNHTGLSEYDIQVRSSAEALAKMFNTYASQLKEAENNAKANFNVDVEEVNGILESIRDLNTNIWKAEIHGDPALELKDERNLLIDKLSQYVKIDVHEEPEDVGGGKVNKLIIRLADKSTDLVNGNYCGAFSITDDNTLQMKFSKLIDARGRLKDGSLEHTLSEDDLYGALQAERDFLTKKGEFSTEADLQKDPDAAGKRGIGYYKDALDLLAKQFADTFNQANQGYVRNEKGQYVKDDGTVINDDAGNPVTDKTFPDINNLNDYLDKNGGHRIGKPLFASKGDTDETGGINAANITISKSWTTGPQIVNSFVRNSSTGSIGSTDSSNISHMLVLLGKKIEFKPGEGKAPMFEGTFNEMWDNIGTVLGNDMMTTTTMLNTYQTSSVQLDMGRDAVSSVDLNDEAASLMQYSKSYSAACRLMTTLDTVLEKLIDGTGVTR